MNDERYETNDESERTMNDLIRTNDTNESYDLGGSTKVNKQDTPSKSSDLPVARTLDDGDTIRAIYPNMSHTRHYGMEGAIDRHLIGKSGK